MPLSPKVYPLCVSLCLLLAQAASPIIFPSGDNAKNQTPPDTERTDIFNAVGRSVNTGTGSGSAVYLGGKYVLTANHVNLLSNITFDGSTLYKRDTAFSPRQVSDTDLKVIKLEKVPTGLVGVTLNTSISDFNKTGTIVGWGRGRSTSDTDGSNGWTWGNSTTEAKRWGTNAITSAAIFPSYGDTNGNTYTNTPVLVTILNSGLGVNDDEAAAADLDSGGGIFAKFGNEWRLIGLTILSSNPSNFNNTDQNYFVRISTYESTIQDEIPDTSVYADWKVDHSLYGADALDDADTDSDGIGQLQEFAFGGDPNVNDISILPTFELVEDGGSSYLELSVTRPIGLQDITYTPKTTTDLSSWPSDSTGIVDDNPTPVDNLDGTETLTYRRSGAVASADAAFIRVDVSETP
ncbi:MAG: hypothetical protein NWR36_05820 [Opitutales bacterium]|nr:hypothetical protein [Opitutales bacterium]